MTKDDVRAYYETFAEREWQRLTNLDDGAIEYVLTCATLEQHLPPSGRILDLGGGPGRYTIWLAQHGYYVTLADLSPVLLDIARTQIADAGVGEQVEAVVETDACDLSRWPDASFDAVVCLGPFYHLPDVHDRERAARELVRVLRPGGIAFVALLPRYTLLRRTFAIPDERQHLADPAWVERLQTHGIFENTIPGRFNHAYGAQPAEIAPFFHRYGLEPRTLLAADWWYSSSSDRSTCFGSIFAPAAVTHPPCNGKRPSHPGISQSSAFCWSTNLAAPSSSPARCELHLVENSEHDVGEEPKDQHQQRCHDQRCIHGWRNSDRLVRRRFLDKHRSQKA